MIRREVIIRYQLEVPGETTYGDVKRDVQETLKQLTHKPVSAVVLDVVAPQGGLEYPDGRPIYRTIIERTKFTQD